MRNWLGGWLASICEHRNDIFAMACVFGIQGCMLYALTHPVV